MRKAQASWSPERPFPGSWVGRTVGGRYRIERAIGRGAAGIVYGAVDVSKDTEVAIKVIHETLAGDPTIRGRFEREIRAAKELQSPHVARVLDVLDDDQVPAVVMEFLDGRDLAVLLEGEGPLPIDRAIGYVLEACEGVAVAHARGIVHRDIKPANLFLTNTDAGEVVKVLDFGVSKVSWDDHVKTAGEETLGTPSYMSPEQLTSSRTADARADVWSLGVVLYELLTKKLPFPATNTAWLCVQIMTEPPEKLLQSRPDTPRALVGIIERCLQKQRELRFDDAAALRDALVAFTKGEAPVDDTTQRVTVMSLVRASQVLPVAAKKKPTVPPAVWLVLIVVLAVGIAVAVFLR